MTDQDYLELIGFLKEQLRTVGLESLTDDERYVEYYSGEKRLPSPRVQLKHLLSDLELEMAVRDRQTYDRALRSIRLSSHRKTSPRVVVRRTPRVDQPSPDIDMEGVPRLTGVRKSIEQLMRLLAEESDPPVDENISDA